jgi:hypothetical protein
MFTDRFVAKRVLLSAVKVGISVTVFCGARNYEHETFTEPINIHIAWPDVCNLYTKYIGFVKYI